MESLIFLVSLILSSLSVMCHSSLYTSSSVKVFYVKPTSPASAECPSGENVPCHTLQYYADHSNFTSNCEFHFLKGEHLLDSVVNVINITNLSLIGAGSGVKILCQSVPSGFHVTNFSMLKLENFSVSECNGSANVTILLEDGSEASISHVNISSSRGGGVKYHVSASSCVESNHSVLFNHNFLNTSGNGLLCSVHCSNNIQIIMANCTVYGYSQDGLVVYFSDTGTNFLISVNKAIFVGAGIRVMAVAQEGLLLQKCSCNYFMKFIEIMSTSCAKMQALLYIKTLSTCGILIKDSNFSNSHYSDSLISLHYITNVTLQNVNVKRSASPYILYCRRVKIIIINCTFEDNTGSVIIARSKSLITFQGTNMFRNNTGETGAALQLHDISDLKLLHNTTVHFLNNHASVVGGAIHAAYAGYEITNSDVLSTFCFVDHIPDHGIKLIFRNNTAVQAGSHIFGGVNQCCYPVFPDTLCNGTIFNDIFNISNTEADPSALASDPYRVCLCEHNRRQPNCSCAPDVINTVPGGVFTLRLAVVDQYYEGVVPGDIHAYFENSSTNTRLGTLQSTQASTKAHCSDFTYTVFSTNKDETLNLEVEKSLTWNMVDSAAPLLIPVQLHDCPLGFALSHDISKCVCAPAIDRDNVKCFIEDRKILCQGNSWIGFVNTSSHNADILFNDYCPSGYCLAHPVNVTATSGDDQCESHRTGILCGQCKEGYSLKFSTQECRKCSNTYLLLIFPLAFLGILLVALLFILNLTVSEGTINGLIFYANVIEMNYVLRLPKQQNYLYIFLAWLNLDLGINTCLFDGMDAYTETWLQFVFPFYLWMIILLIIVFYNKFPTAAARLGGGNAVNVLATLLLLSYTKLQQTVVTILSFTNMEYSSGRVHYVWLYDANVEYFKGKHLYLGITAIAVLVLLIIPYTLCLAFFQHLQAHSQHRIFHWVNKLKPVFDAYAGPYKDRFRFWTGMLLIIRTLLIIIFTTKISGSIDLNLLVTLVVSLTLLLASSNGIYRKWHYNYLESFFYIQLGVFAGGVAYAKDHGSVTAVVYTSSMMALVITIVVMGYHCVYRLATIRNHVYLRKSYADLGEEDPYLGYERLTS